MQGYEERLKLSIKRFEIVKPILIRDLKIDEVYSVEKTGIQSDLAKALDIYSGIDLLVLRKRSGIIGIASRMMTYQGYKTVTLRDSLHYSGKDTEYQKLSNALNSNGCLVSHYFITAYFTKDNELVTYCICRTIDILDMIDKGVCFHKNAFKTGDGYMAIYFSDFIKHKKPVIIDGVLYKEQPKNKIPIIIDGVTYGLRTDLNPKPSKRVIRRSRRDKEQLELFAL